MHFNPNASFPYYPNRRGNMGQKKPQNIEHFITLKIKDSANTETPASSNKKEETIHQIEEIKTKETISTQKKGTTKGMVLIIITRKIF